MAHLVEVCEECGRRELLAVDGHWVALFKVDFDVGRLVWRLLRRHRPGKHVLGGLRPGVFQQIAAAQKNKKASV